MSSTIWSESPVLHIQDLSTEIVGRASSLTKRGKDAFNSLYLQCGFDVASLAYTLLSSDFSWGTYHSGLGGKTLEELKAFTAEIIALIRKHSDAPGLEEWDVHEKKAKFGKYGISGNAADNLLHLELSLGHFPVAAFALSWLSSRNERDYFIYRHGFSIWKDANELPLSSISEHLGVTAERCRQIRKQLMSELSSVFQGLGLAAPCPYDYLSTELDCIVNQEEGTSFSINFIRFLIGCSYSSLSVVGSLENSLLASIREGKDDTFVAAIPRSLSVSFDFDSFLDDLSSINGEKHTETQYRMLPDWPLEAKDLAAALARLRYGWNVDNEQLVVPPNSDKNRPDIMEDIIRDAGHPLSISEIETEYAKRYPDRETDRSRIRGNIQGNPRIVPIGRSGIYSLAKWTSGSFRGGTIRSFVRECLDNSDTHIVPTKTVFEYVRNFRPTSSDENIISNLMLDTDKSFRIIWKDGVSYLHYSSETIPEGYRQITRSSSERHSFRESIASMDEFISHYGRQPKVCANPDETRLARFLSNQRSLSRRGLLGEKGSEELRRIEARLSDGLIQLELF